MKHEYSIIEIEIKGKRYKAVRRRSWMKLLWWWLMTPDLYAVYACNTQEVKCSKNIHDALKWDMNNDGTVSVIEVGYIFTDPWVDRSKTFTINTPRRLVERWSRPSLKCYGSRSGS